MSSKERISQTCAAIAKLGGGEGTMDAAMHWLANLDQPWLLIIDNADDVQIKLEEYFPKGSRGHVLVTTRNRDIRRHGNIGAKFFEFKGLNADDANSLLLKAAGQPTPWDSHLSSTAARITKALGFLALAITHAGTAISSGLCSLKNYLSFHEAYFSRIRSKRRFRQRHTSDETDPDNIYASFEISYSIIEDKDTDEARDAIQLFKVFAFFHHENIQFDILERAVNNRILEVEQEEKQKEEERQKAILERSSTWSSWLRKLPFELIQYLLTNTGPVVLPAAIRDAHDTAQFDEYRLRRALRALAQRSLIIRNDFKDQESYSMHPLVHTWARERPENSLAEQAMWSEAAALTLSHSLLLPPLPIGDSSSEEAYRAVILPHIEHVLKSQRSINEQINKKKRSSWWPWSTTTWPLNRGRAIMYAKFSVAYAYCGRFSEAESLQVTVKDFLLQMLGIQHVNTRRIMLALATSLREQGRGDEAERLQVEVLDHCKTALEADHHEILAVKGTLGETLFRQGRYSDAIRLQEDVISGLEKLHGRKHEDTLTAIGNLGLTVMQFQETTDLLTAQRYYSEAADGMKELLGPKHLKTLTAKENLAVVASYLDKDLDHALEMIDEVFEERKARLGKEHPYTLLAMVNKAKITRALGHLDDAELVLRSGIAVADRNLGRDHDGTLLGRYELAKVLIRQGRYEETESILVGVIELYKDKFSYRGDHHPLRLGAIYELFVCYKLQGRTKECLDVADKGIQGFAAVSERVHPLARRMREERSKLLEEERLVDV
jgi:tetratricopeptide (TPR) repeat protein